MLSGGGGVRKGWKRMVASITLLVILVLDGATSQSEFPFLHPHPPARAPHTHTRAHAHMRAAPICISSPVPTASPTTRNYVSLLRVNPSVPRMV